MEKLAHQHGRGLVGRISGGRDGDVLGSKIEFAPRGGLDAGRAAERQPLFAVVSPVAAVVGAGATV